MAGIGPSLIFMNDLSLSHEFHNINMGEAAGARIIYKNKLEKWSAQTRYGVVHLGFLPTWYSQPGITTWTSKGQGTNV